MSSILGALFSSDTAFAPFLTFVSDAGITFPTLDMSFSDSSDPHFEFDIEADFILPPPFQQPSASGGSGNTAMILHFSKNISSAAYELSGSFSTSVLLPGLDAPVGISASASVVDSKGTVEVAVSGNTTAPFSFPSLPCLQFGAMELSASFSLGRYRVIPHNSLVFSSDL